MTVRIVLFLASVVLLILPSTVLQAAQWYVDDSVEESGGGITWETAFKTIQEGIDAAANGDKVIVAEGTYVENIHFDGKNIVLTSTDPLDTDVVANTIIDGSEAGSVVTFSGTETEACILSGFTIRNGRANSGGGIYGGTPTGPTHATIENNTITGNKAELEYGGTGGGVYACNGTIQNNVIGGNLAAAGGGGLETCDGTIQNNTIVANSGGNYGGGLGFCNGTIQNNTIVGNSAGDYGGGLDDCSGTIRNCIIWGNSAPTRPQLDKSSIPTFSCIQGWGGGGQGNIVSEPRFVNAEAGDYRLQEGSPCIDAGLNHYWFVWPQRDLDGNCRLARLAVDMGCYEYRSSSDSDGDLLSNAAESKTGTDPLKEDSDGDGLRDGLELLRASNPLQVTLPGILKVPSDFATIQQSLCVSVTGDEIIVAPGAYYENLQFCGPDIILRSSDTEERSIVSTTIIDGGGAAPVVWFMGHESEACVLAGFTIRNGRSYLGGGIKGNGTQASIQNNAITGNLAELGGGLSLCDGTIENNTITGNSADIGGGGLQTCDGTIQNCIVWGNTAPSEPQLRRSSIPNFSCIQGWSEAGEGNIAEDPLFADPDGPDDDSDTHEDNDYRLSENSPCIDKGMNEDGMPEALDLDGNPRIFYGKFSRRVDMGAYEYGSWPFRITGVAKKELPGGGTELAWKSRPGDTYIIWSGSNLSAKNPWTTMEATLPSEGDETTWTDPDTTSTFKFYRIEIE